MVVVRAKVRHFLIADTRLYASTLHYKMTAMDTNLRTFLLIQGLLAQYWQPPLPKLPPIEVICRTAHFTIK